jgi:DNA-binding NarL/FixJ family response regulator
MKIRIAIAEDNHFLAASIQEKLELFPEVLQFCFRAADGEDLLKKLEQNHAIDVILMDIEMPGMDGIQATRQIVEKFPHIRVLILTVFDDEQRIFDAIQSGALGYLLKDEPPQKLLEAIMIVVKGGASMSSTIAAKTLRLLRNAEVKNTADEKKDFNLGQREIQVLEQLSKGLDYKQIAENLFVSPSTVRKHIENIYRKLHVNNKIKAIQKANRHGLI